MHRTSQSSSKKEYLSRRIRSFSFPRTAPVLQKIHKQQGFIKLLNSITLQEWVTAAVLATALGVAYWGWTLVYEFVKPVLKPLGLKYLVAGFWLLAPIFVGNLIRKPTIALFASVTAAFVESLVTQWGMSAVWSGFIQGLAVELTFLAFLYRRWSLDVLMLAAVISACASYAYDYQSGNLQTLSVGFNLIQLSAFCLSGVVLAAWLTQYLSARLLKTGLIDHFLIAKMFK